MRVPLAVGALSAAAATAVSPFVALAAFAGVLVAALVVVAPYTMVLLLLVARPMLDLAPGGLAIPGGQRLDMATAAAMALIMAAGWHLVTARITLRAPLAAPFAALVAVAAVSAMLSGDPARSGAGVARLLSQFALYLLVFHAVSRSEDARGLLVVLVAGALPPVVWGFAQIVSGNGEYLYPGESAGIAHARLSGPSGSGLTMGTMLLIPLVLSVVWTFEARSVTSRIMAWIVLLILAVALYFSLARMVWIAFALAIVLLGILRYRMLLIMVPLVLILSAAAIPGVGSRWAPVLGQTEGSTLEGRFELWSGAMEVFQESPLLGAGIGVGSVEGAGRTDGTPGPAHSDYVAALADMGALGFGVMLWLLLASGVAGWRAVRSTAGTRWHMLSATFLAVWVAFLLIRLSGNVLTHQVFQYPFWALAAAALAMAGRASNREEGSGELFA